MLKLRKCSVILFYCWCNTIHAHRAGTLVIVAPKKWEFDVMLDKRKSIFLNKNLLGDNVSTTVNGINMGVTCNKKFRLGIGAYIAKANGYKALFISKPYYVNAIRSKAPSAIPVSINGLQGYMVNSGLNLYYITPSIEYLFFTSKWLTLGIPLEVGVGYSKLSLTDFFSNTPIPIVNSKGKVFSTSNYFFPALAGINVRVNLSPDVALTGTIGYRKILKEIGISQNFDGIYYQIGLRLLPQHIKRELIADFKNWRGNRKAN